MLLHFSSNLPISRHWSIKGHQYLLTSSFYLGIEKHGNNETKRMNKSPHISNCSVASDYLGKFLILIIIFIFSMSNVIFLSLI